MPDVHQKQREMLLAVIKLACFGLVVDLFGIGVMAWQHTDEALFGLTVGLLAMVFSLCVSCYRLGALSVQSQA